MTKKLKTLIILLILISGIIVASGYIYYRQINLAEDPRIIDARVKMKEYNRLMGENETDLALLLLDHVESVYMDTPGYSESYEPGVINNNRGSIFLIKAENYFLKNKKPDRENLLLARQNIEKGIEIYRAWIDKITPMEKDQVRSMILPFFSTDDPAFAGLNLDKIIEKRVNDIMASRTETMRRLSVGYTNLGIVCRYEGRLEEAGDRYKKAIELWEDNYVAKDNLNRLMGLPPEKRNILKQLFFKKK